MDLLSASGIGGARSTRARLRTRSVAGRPAATFARRILELPESSAPAHAKTRTSAQKVLRASEANGRNEHQVRLTTVMCKTGFTYVITVE